MSLILWGLAAFLLSSVLTRLVGHLAARRGLVDRPTIERKIHPSPVPLAGGAAIYAAIVVVMFILLATGDRLTGGEITVRQYVGFALGGLILMIGGLLDDKFNLPPRLTIIAPLLAATSAVLFGIEVEKITNPLGGVIMLYSWQSDILVFVWLMAVMYTTKFLDGLDGLSTGVASIGALMIMLLALSAAYFQPDVALLSAVCLGALLGFLPRNFHPASIFLGEGGSTFVGFTLGVLAVISGGKLATALLVLGIPLLDLFWVVVRRFSRGGVRNVFRADRQHLHHRLLDLGWGQRRIVLGYWLVAAAFGISTLFLQSREKLVALVALTVMMLFLALWLAFSGKCSRSS